MEGEASLPKATMQKMVREALPPDIRVAGDAFDLIIECCTGAPVAAWPDHASASDVKAALQGSCWADAAARCAEFVQLVSSEANEMSDKEKKSTITPEHVLAALQQLGFSEFQGDLQAFYGDVKESNAQQGLQRRGSRKTGAEKSGLSDEEQVALQRKLFSEARARTSGLVTSAEAEVPAIMTAAQAEQG